MTEKFLEADPDIAGIGVLVSFSASSIFTLIGITAGYFLNAIRDQQPDSLLNDLDIYVLRCCQCRLVHNRHTKAKKNHCRALEQFVLTLTDQQIITGLAIFVIGYSKSCTMSSYHFILILCMGWFSSTTHLSSLTVLQNYFSGFPALKYVRLVGIFVTFVMLFIGMFITLFSRFPLSAPVQCRFSRLSLRGNTALSTISAAFLFGVLIFMHSSKILSLCFSKGGRPVTLRDLFVRHLARNGKVVVARKTHYIQCLRNISESTRSPLFKQIREYFCTFNYVFVEFLDSFLWQIIWLAFWNGFGIRQLIWARMYVGGLVDIEGDEDQWSFGQVVPLFLLLIPLLIGAEALYAPALEGTECSSTLVQSQSSSAQDLPPLRLAPNGQSLRPQTSPSDQSDHSTRALEFGTLHDSSKVLSISSTDNRSTTRDKSYTARIDLDSAYSQTQSPSPFDLPCASRAVQVLLVTLLLYTVTTLTLVVYYVGVEELQTIGGIESTFAMVTLLLLMAVGPYWTEYRRITSCRAEEVYGFGTSSRHP